MNLKIGQVWRDIRYPSFCYRIVMINYDFLYKKSALCEFYYFDENKKQLFFISGGYNVIVKDSEYSNWKNILDF